MLREAKSAWLKELILVPRKKRTIGENGLQKEEKYRELASIV